MWKRRHSQINVLGENIGKNIEFHRKKTHLCQRLPPGQSLAMDHLAPVPGCSWIRRGFMGIATFFWGKWSPESPMFHGKIDGFRLRFSRENQSTVCCVFLCSNTIQTYPGLGMFMLVTETLLIQNHIPFQIIVKLKQIIPV